MLNDKNKELNLDEIITDKVLKENNIHYKFLSNTKDIWAVDYMPIQVQKEKFIQFRQTDLTYYRIDIVELSILPIWKKLTKAFH